MSAILALTILPSFAAAHTLAPVALIFEEVRIIGIVRIYESVAGRITLDKLFGVTTDLRGRARSTHDAVKHFAVFIAENHRKATVTAGATALRSHTSAATTALVSLVFLTSRTPAT
jgi:hypothetical protein